MKDFPRLAWQKWNWFWFDSRSDGDLVVLSAFRLFFPLVMFFCYLARVPDLEFFYGANGIMPAWHIKNVDFFRYHYTMLGDSWSLVSIQVLHSFFLFCLLLLAAGFQTRWVAVLCYVLHLTFHNRNMSVMFGVDMIATFYFLYLCFANCNARWSVDAWLRKGAKKQSGISHLALRLMQIQLCVIYGYSGMEKLKGVRWWDGSALWDVLSIGTMQRWDMSFVSNFPALLAVGAYVVLLWEVYFPVLIWTGLRRPMLVFGFLMHVGIFLFMNLPSFGFMMITLYLLFLQKAEVERGMAPVEGIFLFSRPRQN